MRYAGINYNDIAAGPGISLSFFTQGCPHRCYKCHNPETWSFDGGHEFTMQTLNHIIQGLKANGVDRHLSIMGGEPMCPENIFLVSMIIMNVQENYPETKIYLWTGYTYEELKKRQDQKTNWILNNIDYLIDGPYIHEERDITLPMRGSRNQRIIDLKAVKK